MRRTGLWIAAAAGILAMLPPPAGAQDTGTKEVTTPSGVTVYKRIAELKIIDEGKGPAKTIPLRLEGSKGLKVAFLARGAGGVTRAPFNMFDAKASDNTTAKAYAWVGEKWRPILYRCDRFQYNAIPNSTVKGDVKYRNIRFHGPATAEKKGVLHLRNFVIYRGEDTDPPTPPGGLRAKSTEKGVRLTWGPADDNVLPAMYVISRAGKDGKFAKIAQSCLPGYVDKPPAGGTYQYRVLAADYQDNLSKWSKAAKVEVSQGFEATKPTDLETDRAGYAEHVRKIAKAGAKKVRKGRVLLFGDSLTGALNYQLFAEAALGRYPVDAIGRAGWRTGQGRKVIAGDIAKMNPQFCLILYGTNNSKSAKAIEAAMDDLLAIAKACETNGTIPVIGTIPPRGFSDPKSKPEADYNAALIKTCRANKIPIGYIFEEMQAQPDRRKQLAGDGVHWAGAGFTTANRAWQKVMQQVGFVLLDRP